MPLFRLHRNYVLRTTKGHTIRFEKDRPTHVPPLIVNDAVAIGAVPIDGKVDVLGEEVIEQAPLTPAEREEAVMKAFRVMKERNERMDFTASGLPNTKKVIALTGFEITSRERDAYWQQFRTDQQEAFDQAELDAKVEAKSQESTDE